MSTSVDAETLPPIPRISLQAFCETSELAETIATAAEDRRMDKAQVRVQMGGAPGAVEAFRSSPTPNVLILETVGRRNEVLNHLDELAESCDPSTKVIVVGQVNDIHLYRELMNRGVSDYLIAPIEVMDVVGAVANLFAGAGAKVVGRTLAVIGAKGGVGASTVAHNLAWAMSTAIGVNTCIVDLDLPFGTAGLDFNQDPAQGVADAVFAPDRIDMAFIDRVMSRCSEQLTLMAAPAMLDKVYDFSPEAFDVTLDLLRQQVPAIVLDVPHVWTGWAKRIVASADDIVIVAAPDLANLRNTKNLADLLRAARPNDPAPRYLLNQVGVPKRPEIKAGDFAKALEADPAGSIPFDPALFGTAANNGQMIAEMEPSHKIALQFAELAFTLTGRAESKKPKANLLGSLNPLLEKFAQLRKKA